jgi:hypothetical protein
MAACLATIVFHYVLYLWVLRSLLWFRLNRAVTRQEVRLRPLHPDRCGGLSYLGRAALTWTILVVSIGILVALDFAYGVIARNGLKGAFGEWQYWVKIIAYIALAPFVLVGPLLPWRPHLCHEKHRCYRLLLSFGNSHARSLAAALDSAARGPLEQLPAEPMLKALTGVQSLYERLAESVAKMRTIPMDMHTTIRAGWTYVWPMSLSLSAFLANIAQVLSK